MAKKNQQSPHTYISLFSSAGVGCYGFKLENFYCVATVEFLERRLKIQRFNHKCVYDSGYICGDMTLQETKDRILAELTLWKKNFHLHDLDAFIATPPCQGMSVANHKKKDELKRNSLVVESISMTKLLKPKFFIFENVKTFLQSICTDIDNTNKPIREAIESNLSGDYNILYRVVNFKDYGCPSSRTRTLVIGVRKDLKEVTPFDLFPDRQKERTLRETIGDLPCLSTMGEIDPTDIYHSFRSYSPHMEAWISDLSEGQSAFDNSDISKIPHTIKNGVIVYNAKKNGDKYTRQYWDKVAPCVHTRNDILASQNTIHPRENRVFSIRELMRMMSVPEDFNWSRLTLSELNALPVNDKIKYLKKEEINIRQCLGEAVPTVIFKQVAHKIATYLSRPTIAEENLKELILRHKLMELPNLIKFIKGAKNFRFYELAKVAEIANSCRDSNAAYYTRQDICYAIVKSLPEYKSKKILNILEPSIGVGNFLPSLIEKYSNIPEVNIDVVDIDEKSLTILQTLIDRMSIPKNINVNFIYDDFLLFAFSKRYDIVVGNPPFMRFSSDKALLSKYKESASNKNTNNTFAFFLEKAINVGRFVSLIVPKSLINAPEFNVTREILSRHSITRIFDFGEKAFRGVKIETLCLQIDVEAKPSMTTIESYITNTTDKKDQAYITDKRFPYWLIYRNKEFDDVAEKMKFNVFKAYRDRTITKMMTKETGKIRVLKSRNIGDNKIIDLPGYDCYIDDVSKLDVGKYLDKANCVLVPNLSYSPRACFLPKNCITDGSVAILTTIAGDDISEDDLAYYATREFVLFYDIARNKGTRSLNIDNNSVFFFGILK